LFPLAFKAHLHEPTSTVVVLSALVYEQSPVHGTSAAFVFILVLHLLLVSTSPLAHTDHLLEAELETLAPLANEKYSVHAPLLHPCVLTHCSSLVHVTLFPSCLVHVLLSVPIAQYDPIKHFESWVQTSPSAAPGHFPSVQFPVKQEPISLHG
jgi:hypothetical protein